MRRTSLVAALTTLLVAAVAPSGAGASPPSWSHAGGGRVLRVGTWHGIPGKYSTIQSAVDAARPGDWVLIAPGDYHEQGSSEDGVRITTPNIHLRGLDRNGVVVDGTKPGAPQCSDAQGDQGAHGRSGVEVFEANGVTIDNLTVCNFLNQPGGGNEIWWNGGDGTGTQNLSSFGGSYLSATSTYWKTGDAHAEYGIFVSNVTGPGKIAHTYASNMADASYYIGACPDCNTILDDAHAQYSALGYSGTNSGGHLIIRNSEFDNNKTGVSTNSQNNDDAPSPQDGSCPNNGVGPTGSHSCWLFVHNWVHDNNWTTAPGSGTAELGPPGTGIVIAGGRNDTVIGNKFSHNNSWAVLVVPYVDTGTPPPVAHCDGGEPNWNGLGCYYADWGNEVAYNKFDHNGGYGNPTNGDLADLSDLHDPGNCWHDNFDWNGVTSAPADIQATHAQCGVPNAGEAVLGSDLSNQVLCATELLGPCPPGVGNYPRSDTVTMPPLARQVSMPDPCFGVPANPWCHGGHGHDDHVHAYAIDAWIDWTSMHGPRR